MEVESQMSSNIKVDQEVTHEKVMKSKARGISKVEAKNRLVTFGKAEDYLNVQQKESMKKTHFTSEQVQALTKIYGRLTVSGKMDRLRFRDFIYSTFDITDDLILDRMFHVFSDDTGVVSESQWISRLSVLTRGNIEEKMAYVFQLYDITGDKTISREQVDHFLRNSVSTAYGVGGVDIDEVPDAVREIGDTIFKRLDVDHNGLITPDDFFQACTIEPLMLEALGHCLPSNKYIKSFLILFADDYNQLDAGYSRNTGIGHHNSIRGPSMSQPSFVGIRNTVSALPQGRMTRKSTVLARRQSTGIENHRRSAKLRFGELEE